MMLRNNFSEIYHRLLPELMEVEVPEEKWADCLNCHHCIKPDQERYLTKCCDYRPSIPNYVIGGILSDTSPELHLPQQLIRDQINAKKGVTPFGIVPSLAYQQALKEDRANNRGTKMPSGHRTSLLCSFYDKGMCTIHKYRADICGSFFCYSTSSIQGKQLSKRLQTFSKSLDWKLAYFTASQIKPNMDSIGDLEKLKNTATLIENNKASVEDNYQSLWGPDAGKEEAYFKTCFKLVKSLTASDANEILGDFLKTGTEEIKKASEVAFQNITPEFLFFHEKRYKSWLEECKDHYKVNSLELFLLKLFNGKKTSKEIILQAKDFDKRFPRKISTFVEHGILSEKSSV